MAAFIIFFDASVLYPAELRNFLMHLAVSGIFHAQWPSEVHEEWIRSLLSNRPDLTREQLERTQQLMDKAAPNALVTGYEHLIPGLILPDDGDRHVLTVAIHCGASLIVTSSLKDFPAEVLGQFNIEAQEPDDCILNLFDLSPALVAEAAEHHRTSLKNPPKTIEEYLTSLESQGLLETASALRK